MRRRQLLDDLKALLEKGRQEAKAEVNRIRVETYWKMGKRIAEMKEVADPAGELLMHHLFLLGVGL